MANKKHIATILLCLLLLVGFGVFSAPTAEAADNQVVMFDLFNISSVDWVKSPGGTGVMGAITRTSDAYTFRNIGGGWPSARHTLADTSVFFLAEEWKDTILYYDFTVSEEASIIFFHHNSYNYAHHDGYALNYALTGGKTVPDTNDALHGTYKGSITLAELFALTTNADEFVPFNGHIFNLSAITIYAVRGDVTIREFRIVGPGHSIATPPAEPLNPPANVNLPQVHITMEDKYSSAQSVGEALDRDVWRNSTVSISGVEDEYLLSDTSVRIRGRGNSTWGMGEKKPFRIRFSEPQSLLDAGHKAKDWTFLANHFDRSLLRNLSSYYLSAALDGISYTPYIRSVEVYLNGVYQGVYTLSIQVSEVTEGRVDLDYNSTPALSEYLIERDERAKDEGVEGVDYVTVQGVHYAIIFPSDDALTSAHVEYVRSYLTRVDNALSAGGDGVYQDIDLASFVDYYIVQELYKNTDAGTSSVFMQIKGQGSDRRLEMGPVWDFDISAGATFYVDRNNEFIPGSQQDLTQLWVPKVNHWYGSLIQNKSFLQALAVRWDEVKDGQIEDTLAYINTTALQHRTAFERNFTRWPIFDQYVWPSPPEVLFIRTYLGHVQYLVDYLENRIAFLDEVYSYIERPAGAVFVWPNGEKPSTWARAEVQSAYERGLAPLEFMQNYRDDMSRIDFAVMAVRFIEVASGMSIDDFLAKQETLINISFSDTNDKVIMAAAQLGIVEGIGDGSFNPQGSITRATAAVMLARTLRVLGYDITVGAQTTYADQSQIRSWARNAVNFMNHINVMTGASGGNFEPDSPYTIETSLVTYERMFVWMQA